MVDQLKLPNFLILGAQKAGTTTLHDALNCHPQVFMSHPKELVFFNRDDNYQRGLQWYSSYFEGWKDQKVAGESTPSYLWDERVPLRIKKDLPDIKFIILLRNPVDRAYSAYWYAFIGGNETLSFEEGLAAEENRAKQGDLIRGFSSYVDRGLYASQIKRYLDIFSSSQFLFLITEDYRKQPEIILNDVTNFLELDCQPKFLENVASLSRNASRIPRSFTIHKSVPYLRRNFNFGARIIRRLNLKTAKYPPIVNGMRQKLYSIFEESINDLEKLIGRNLDIWRLEKN